MSNFISGIQQRVNDTANQVSNTFSDATHGGPSSSSDAPHQDISKGLSDGNNAFSGMNRQYQKDQEDARREAAEGDHHQQQQQQGKNKFSIKKVGKFIKSAFGYGKAAKKGEHAVEELTGRDLNSFAHRETAA